MTDISTIFDTKYEKQLQTNIQELQNEYFDIMTRRQKVIIDFENERRKGTLTPDQEKNIQYVLAEIDRKLVEFRSKTPLFLCDSGFWNQSTNIWNSKKRSFISTNTFNPGRIEFTSTLYTLVAAATARQTDIISQIRIIGKNTRNIYYEKKYEEYGIFTDRDGLIGGLIGSILGVGALAILPVAVAVGVAGTIATGGTLPAALGTFLALSTGIGASAAAAIGATAFGTVLIGGISGLAVAILGATAIAGFLAGGITGLISTLKSGLQGFKNNINSIQNEPTTITILDYEPLIFEVITTSKTTIMSTYTESGMTFNITGLENIEPDPTEDDNFILLPYETLQQGYDVKMRVRNYTIGGSTTSSQFIGTRLSLGIYTLSIPEIKYIMSVGSLRYIDFNVNIYLVKPRNISFQRQLLLSTEKLKQDNTIPSTGGVILSENRGILNTNFQTQINIISDDIYAFEVELTVYSNIVATPLIASDAEIEMILKIS